MGLEPVFDTPEEFGRFLKEDRAASARIVKEYGMEPNDHQMAHPRLSPKKPPPMRSPGTASGPTWAGAAR